MKTLSLLVASLFIAMTGVAQSPEKAKNAEARAKFPPVRDIHAHVCGIHFYNGDLSRQVIAEHYCSRQ